MVATGFAFDAAVLFRFFGATLGVKVTLPFFSGFLAPPASPSAFRFVCSHGVAVGVWVFLTVFVVTGVSICGRSIRFVCFGPKTVTSLVLFLWDGGT